MQSLTKAHHREIRKLAGIAHERELAKATRELQGEFERWRAGEIDVFELNERIHKFHNGASRDLYKQYVMSRDAESNVAVAILDGIIHESEVLPAILEYLQSTINSIRAMRATYGEA